MKLNSKENELFNNAHSNYPSLTKKDFILTRCCGQIINDTSNDVKEILVINRQDKVDLSGIRGSLNQIAKVANTEGLSQDFQDEILAAIADLKMLNQCQRV